MEEGFLEILLLSISSLIIIIMELIIYHKVILPIRKEQKEIVDYTIVWSDIRNIN